MRFMSLLCHYCVGYNRQIRFHIVIDLDIASVCQYNNIYKQALKYL